MSLFTNVPKRSRYLLAGLLTVGLISFLHRPNRRPLRGELLRIRETYRDAFALSQGNLSNQFTPGFKSRTAWGGECALTWTQGEIFKTRTLTNLAINGVGCFGLNSEGKTAYTRDGRFTFDSGLLTHPEGWEVLAFPLDTLGNIKVQAGSVRLDMDPNTCLYLGRYTGFHFDETGKLYGEITMTDPVTGQQAITNAPLYQIILYQFPAGSGLAPLPSSGPTIWQSRAGQWPTGGRSGRPGGPGSDLPRLFGIGQRGLSGRRGDPAVAPQTLAGLPKRAGQPAAKRAAGRVETQSPPAPGCHRESLQPA